MKIGREDSRAGPWLRACATYKSPRGAARMAELLGVSRQSVHRWRQKNKIPSWRLKDLHRLVAEGAIDGVEVTDD